MWSKVRDILRYALRPEAAWCYLGDGTGAALTHTGRIVFLSTDDIGITPAIALRGRWEPPVEATLRRLLRPGMTVAEVGANVGYHTLVMAEAVGPEGRVHSFEPYPKVLRLLRRTLAANSAGARVTLHAAAALDRAGEVPFVADPEQAGSANLALPGAEANYSDRFLAPALRLDDALAHLPALDLLRMDAEGSEGLALYGAEALIDRSPNLAIVTEWSPPMLAPRCDIPALAAWLAARGFEAARIGRRGALAPVPMADLPALPHSELLLRRPAHRPARLPAQRTEPQRPPP